MFISVMAASHQLSMLQHSDRQETDGGLVISAAWALHRAAPVSLFSKEQRLEEVKTEVKKNEETFLEV